MTTAIAVLAWLGTIWVTLTLIAGAVALYLGWTERHR